MDRDNPFPAELDIYKKSFDNSPNSMLLVEYKENVPRIVDINDSFTKYYGYNEEEVVGKNPNLIKSGTQDKDRYETMWRSILDPQIGYWRDEFVNRRKDGTFIDVILTVYSIFDAQNKPAYFIANHVDITRRKEAEKQVKDLNELLKLLNKILRHDLLNDITVAKGDIKMFLDGIDKEGITDAVPALDRSVGLIGEMRELEGAVSSGKELEKLQTRDIVVKAKETFTDMDISVDGQAEVLADGAFTSVIQNIFRNAKIHGKTNKVDVAITDTHPMVEIRLADYGKGIPDEIKGKLFTEGFKYGESGHTGLGLYIVRKTVERYGGSVSVENNTPNGAVFVLRFPNAKDKVP